MKIAIMGTGTMACLFAGRMAENGHNVVMVSQWREQVENIALNGLILMQDGHEDKLLHPRAVLTAEEAVSDNVFPDLVMISSKGYMTERTVKNALPLIGPETMVLTLQNGMGNADVIARYVSPERVYFGAASIASDSKGLGKVHDNTNRNRTPLVSIVPYSRKDDANCKVLADLFNAIGYSTVAGVSAEYFVWKKLCLNSSANALAGITQLANKVYPNDIDGFILLNHLCRECVDVAQANGIALDHDEMRAFIQKTLYNQNHYISMCQDIHNRRPTEIETINGYIVREGRRLNIDTPYNESVYRLVRLISNHYDERWY